MGRGKRFDGIFYSIGTTTPSPQCESRKAYDRKIGHPFLTAELNTQRDKTRERKKERERGKRFGFFTESLEEERGSFLSPSPQRLKAHFSTKDRTNERTTAVN